MNRALQIIALQHELAMAIGNSLNLNEMLSHFLRICLKRFNLAGIHTYLLTDKFGAVQRQNTGAGLDLKHYLSIPCQHEFIDWKNDAEFLAQANRTLNGENVQSVKQGGCCYQFLVIPGHGCIVLESMKEIDNMLLRSLHPILEKLASSCLTSITHESLKKEIAGRKLAEDTVVHQANHDSLTQLANRRKLNDEIHLAVLACKKNGTFGSVIFIDLDQFKSINDLVGHEVGDEILRQVASRLSSLRKGNYTIARFGGDEFIFMQPDLGGDYQKARESTAQMANRICQVLNEVFHVNGAYYNVGCSMGSEIFPRAGQTDSDLIKHADLAMYEAKNARHTTILEYTPCMSERLSARLNYTRDIKSAIADDEFYLQYQPQVDCENNLIGAEALLRWNNSNYENVSPAEYIPIAEESELIHKLGEWLGLTVCQHARQLRNAGLPPTFRSLAINISGKQISRDDFVNSLQNHIGEAGIDPSLISIEITENTLINNIETAIDTISKLRSFGVSCSIDDFGTGYSSLSYLKKLPASTIKIDRAFVKGIDHDGDNQSIARMILALGDSFGMDVVAEGIENEEELKCLKQLGCKKYQGFYFHRPMDFQPFLSMISKLSAL